MSRPTPPPSESPLLCTECSEGCPGHQERCEIGGCECPLVPDSRNRRAERRAIILRNSGTLDDGDRVLLVGALRVAAAQYDKDAASNAATPRIRQQFRSQAIRCRIIADTLDP